MTTSNLSSSDSNKNYIPVLDISPIFYSNNEIAEDTKKEQTLTCLVRQVAFAMENVGFLQISNHNFPSDQCTEISKVQKEYFSLSNTEKNKIMMTPEYPYGYECNEILSVSFDEKDENKGHDNVLKKHINFKSRQKDSKETFQVCLSEYYSGVFEPKIPKKPEKMGEILKSYYNSMCILSLKLMELFALALNLPRDFFDNKVDRHQSSLRLLNYPAIQCSTDDSKELLKTTKIRASEHSDFGVFTILMQDENGGLQVRRSEDFERSSVWEDVEPLKNHFVVNIGDLMMRWTNDRWKSTVHRVVVKKKTLHKTRQSVAFFFNANADAIIETIDSCCLERENKYDMIIAGQYLMTKHWSTVNGKKSA